MAKYFCDIIYIENNNSDMLYSEEITPNNTLSVI